MRYREKDRERGCFSEIERDGDGERVCVKIRRYFLIENFRKKTLKIEKDHRSKKNFQWPI